MANNQACTDRLVRLANATPGLELDRTKASDNRIAYCPTGRSGSGMRAISIVHGEVIHCTVVRGQGNVILNRHGLPPNATPRSGTDRFEIAYTELTKRTDAEVTALFQDIASAR